MESYILRINRDENLLYKLVLSTVDTIRNNNLKIVAIAKSGEKSGAKCRGPLEKYEVNARRNW